MENKTAKKMNFSIEEGSLSFSVDPNQDGQPVLTGKLYLGEAFQEAFVKGKKLDGAKIVDISFEFTKLKIKLDTDQDGQPLLELEIDLAEAFDEIQSAMSKKDPAPAE